VSSEVFSDFWFFGIVGQQSQCRRDQRVRLAEFQRRIANTVGQRNIARPRHQKAEGDGLRITVRELIVCRLREEQRPPFGRQRRQRLAAARQLVRHLVAQQAAETCRNLRELLCRSRRNRRPLQEVGNQRQKRGGAESEAPAVATSPFNVTTVP